VLDIFALLILIILILCAGSAWVAVGMLPGRIAKSRNHPQADAITVCGWCGAITMGILSPIAFVWAYYDPQWRERDRKETPPSTAATEDQQ